MKAIGVVTAAFVLSGCIAMPPSSDNFEEKQIETSHFSLAVWEKKGIQKGKPLRIYFEGDGNPNPNHKVAFDLANMDTTDNVIYVARPCQWTKDKICKQKPEIYQNARFHPEIMKEMKELTSYLMRKHQAQTVELIGYDGGAVIALNMAVELPTTRVITVAGITDINAYTDLNGLPSINENDMANPVDDLVVLAEVPQIHYVGKEDEITPRRLAERFVARMNNPKSAVVKMVPDTNHTNWGGIKLDY